MANRITMEMLQRRVRYLNKLFGYAESPYAVKHDAQGNLTVNAGTFTLDCAYGGYRLGQMCPGGGKRDLTGRDTARGTFDRINAYIDGAETMQRHLARVPA